MVRELASACRSWHLPTAIVSGDYFLKARATRKHVLSENSRRQKGGQRYAQQPSGYHDHRRNAVDGPLAFRHFLGFRLAFFHNPTGNYLRCYQDTDGDYNHLVQQPHAGDEVRNGVYWAEDIADDQRGENLGVPRCSRMPVSQIESVGLRRELSRPSLPSFQVHTPSFYPDRKGGFRVAYLAFSIGVVHRELERHVSAC